MQPLSGNQRPDLLTSLMNMSLVLPREIHLSRSSSNVPRLPSFLVILQNPHVLLISDKVHNPLRLPRETTSERPKVVRTCGAFNILTWKCASRHNGVHFFDMSTSKSGPRMVCFVHFDLEMCFAPQRRALMCTFSTSQLLKVLRTWCALCILTWKRASRHNGVHFFDMSTSKSGPRMVCLYILTWTCASRHNGVQFFISHLTTWLRTRRFGEPTFRPSGATNHWKNTVLRDFPTFSRTCIFFLLTLSLLWSSLFCSSPLWLFPPLLFHLSILSEVWLLNFLR